MLTDGDGNQKPVARFHLVKGLVAQGLVAVEILEPSFPASALDAVLREGIPRLGTGQPCFPGDGALFLESLKFHFNGTYLRAREIRTPAAAPA